MSSSAAPKPSVLPLSSFTLVPHSLRFIGLYFVIILASACGPATGEEESTQVCQPNQCQSSGKLAGDGTCVYTNRANGTSCDDGESCTLYDRCQDGACVGGTTVKDGTQCDDGSVCTQTDSCVAGHCVGANPLLCPPGDACHAGGVCDPKQGCILRSYGPCVQGLASAPLTGCVTSDYYAQLKFGSTSYAVIVDTGSATTAIAGASCANCQVTPLYTPSGTATATNQNATTTYGDNSGWAGSVYRETVQAGLSAGTPLSPAVNMNIVAILNDTGGNFFAGSTCGTTFARNAYTGIWGLGPANLAAKNTDCFMDKAALSSTLRYDALGIGLCNTTGLLSIGGYNPNTVASPPVFTPMVISSPYYSVVIDDALIGTQSAGVSSYAFGPAVIDSGTSYLSLAQTAYDAVVGLITANPNFQANFTGTFFTDSQCQTSKQNLTPAQLDAVLPKFTMLMPSNGVVNGMSVPSVATSSYLQAIKVGNSVAYCSTLVPGTQTILGAAIMRQLMTVIDRQNLQVGFAPLKGCDAAALPSYSSP